MFPFKGERFDPTIWHHEASMTPLCHSPTHIFVNFVWVRHEFETALGYLRPPFHALFVVTQC